MSKIEPQEKKLEKNKLDELVEKQIDVINKFRNTHPDIWQLAYESIDSSHIVPGCLLNQKLSSSETYCLLFWQNVNRYIIDSFLHIVQKNMDVGVALLRMATELARDISCIAGDSKMLEICLKKNQNSKNYRKMFKFNLNSPTGNLIFTLYKFSCKYGIHGHMTDLMFTEKTKDNTHPNLASIEVTHIAVLNMLHLWFKAYNAINLYLIESFFYRKEKEVKQAFRFFLQFSDQLDKVINELGKNLKNMDSDKARLWFEEAYNESIN